MTLGDGEALIELDDVSLGYRDRTLFTGVSLTIRRGEAWGIVGPNGAGKSTLVKTMLGVLPPQAGGVRLVTPRPRFGYVPQRHAVDPIYPLRAIDVAAMAERGMRPLGARRSPNLTQRARQELERQGLAHLAEAPFAALSGGQQQRVLLARALAVDPDVLVLDEPASGIDVLGGADLRRFLQRLRAERDLTVLIISHELGDLADLVDHLCLVNHETHAFEAGPAAAMLAEEKLSRLYGRPIALHRAAGRLHVDVKDAP